MSNNDRNDNETAIPAFTDGAHIAGFEFTGQSSTADRTSKNDPNTRLEGTPLTVDNGVAGVDEPAPSLRDNDELDAWGGPEPAIEPS